MARQMENGMIIGPLGDKSYYFSRGRYLVRTKGGASREKIMNDSCFARTRENNKEFANAVVLAREFQRALRTVLGKAVDISLNSRLIKLFVEIAKTDMVNTRGNRLAAFGDLSKLEGLELNKKSSFSNCFLSSFPETSIDIDKMEVKLKLDLIPKEDIKWPVGSNWCRISNIVVAIDLLNPMVWEIKSSHSEMLRNNGESHKVELKTRISYIKSKTIVQIIAIDFYQELNGDLHELRPFKSVKVVKTSKC